MAKEYQKTFTTRKLIHPVLALYTHRIHLLSSLSLPFSLAHTHTHFLCVSVVSAYDRFSGSTHTHPIAISLLLPLLLTTRTHARLPFAHLLCAIFSLLSLFSSSSPHFLSLSLSSQFHHHLSLSLSPFACTTDYQSLRASDQSDRRLRPSRPSSPRMSSMCERWMMRTARTPTAGTAPPLHS